MPFVPWYCYDKHSLLVCRLSPCLKWFKIRCIFPSSSVFIILKAEPRSLIAFCKIFTSSYGETGPSTWTVVGNKSLFFQKFILRNIFFFQVPVVEIKAYFSNWEIFFLVHVVWTAMLSPWIGATTAQNRNWLLLVRRPYLILFLSSNCSPWCKGCVKKLYHQLWIKCVAAKGSCEGAVGAWRYIKTSFKASFWDLF